MQRQRLAGLVQTPGCAGIRAIEHDRAGATDDPRLVLDGAEGMEIKVRQHVGRKDFFRQAPRCAAADAGENQAALPDRERLLAEDLQAGDITSRQPIGMFGEGGLVLVGGSESAPDAGERASWVWIERRLFAADGCQPAPGAGEDAALAVIEISRQPRGRARSGDWLPTSARIGRLEHAERELLAAVAEQEPRLGIDEADLIQAWQCLGKLRLQLPFQPAVVGEQHDADAPHAVRKLLPANDPADFRRDEMDRTQRGAQAGRLTMPGSAAVERVQDDPFIANGPAFFVVDEINRAERCILDVPQRIVGRRVSDQDEKGQENDDETGDGTHETTLRGR